MSLSRRAVDPFPWSETFDAGANSSGAAIGANAGIFVMLPLRATALAVVKARIWIDTTGNNCDVGFYSSDDTTLTLLTSTGSTVVGSAGAQLIAFLSALQTQQPGLRYWVGLAADNATPKFGRQLLGYSGALGAGPLVQAGSKAASFPLATNAATVTISGLSAVNSRPWIRLAAT